MFSSCRDRAALQKDDTSLLVTSSKRKTAVCLFFLRENFLREKCLSLLRGSPNLVPLQLAAFRYDCDVDSHDLTLLYPMSPRSLLSSFQLGFFRSRISAAIFNAIFFFVAACHACSVFPQASERCRRSLLDEVRREPKILDRQRSCRLGSRTSIGPVILG